MSGAVVRRFVGIGAALSLLGCLGPGVWWVAGSLEAALGSQVNVALARADIDAEVTMRGREARVRVLSGDAAEAISVAAGVPGVAAAVLADGASLEPPKPASTSTSGLTVSPTPSASVSSETSPSPSPSPSVPSPEPAPSVTPFYFVGGSVQMTSKGDARIAELASVLRARPELRASLVGHTDNGQTPQRRYDLGMARAQVIRDGLVAQGVAAERLTVGSRGGEQPTADNGTPEGRALNRRVEVTLEVSLNG